VNDAIVHVTDDNFEENVLRADKPVLVDYWAEWCGPCKMIAPVLDKIAAEYEGKVTIAKLNIDENPSTPQQYGVRRVAKVCDVAWMQDVENAVGEYHGFAAVASER